jgi:hypothetical protein
MYGSVPLVEYPLKVIWKGMWRAREANERRNVSAKISKLLLHHFKLLMVHLVDCILFI